MAEVNIDIAKESTVQEIKNISDNTEAVTTQALNVVGEVNTKANNLSAKAETIETTAGMLSSNASTLLTLLGPYNSTSSTTIFGKLNKSSGVVKSVQRGVATLGSSASVSVAISSVDIAKTTASFMGITATNSRDSDGLCGYVELTSASTVRVYADRSNIGVSMGWEVVEFY